MSNAQPAENQNVYNEPILLPMRRIIIQHIHIYIHIHTSLPTIYNNFPTNRPISYITTFKMVAIQTFLTLAMATIATAAPSLQARGTLNTNIRFFRIDDSACDPGTQTDQASIYNLPLTSGETYAVNTCLPHNAWGSINIDNIQAGCTRKSLRSFLKHSVTWYQ